MNELDILYYESLIDLEIENQKINEALMEPRFMRLFTEANDEIALCENKVLHSLGAFLERILNKVIEFFTNIINFISDKMRFTPNPKLIKMVENRIKNMDDKDKNFAVKYTYKAYKTEWVEDDIENFTGFINYISTIEDFIDDKTKLLGRISGEIYGVKFDNIGYMKDLGYDYVLNKDNMKDIEMTIGYIDIKRLLKEYESFSNNISIVRNKMKQDQLKVNNAKKIINKAITRFSNETNSESLSDIKNVIYTISHIIMTTNKELIRAYQFEYKMIIKSLITFVKKREGYIDKYEFEDDFFDDLEESTILEGFFKKKKKIEPTIPEKQAIPKAIQIMKNILKDYDNQFKKSIKIKHESDDEDEYITVGHYDVWDYSSKARDESVYEEWDKMFSSFIDDTNKELNQYGYYIDIDGDWDDGYLTLESPAVVKESYEEIQESSALSKMTLQAKVRRYNKQQGTKVNNIVDMIKHGYNPGLRTLIKNSKDIDELQYIKKDTHTIIPTLEKIKERIGLCKKHGETSQTESYYKYIKKNYIDAGITEKDVQKAIDEIKVQDKLINDKIKELKKK